MVSCWQRVAVLVVMCLGLFFGVGCGPEYPKCDDSEDCRESEKGKAENKLMCVNGLCQQCAADADCGDPRLECNAGICEDIAGYCTSVDDCPGDQQCRNNRCGPQCLSNDDCPDGQVCQGGTCQAAPQCTTDADCQPGETCQGGQCVSDTAGGPCQFDTIYFAYDDASLSDEARQALQQNARCIKERNARVLLTGHTDQRGSDEYNIALGERRVRSAYNYLKTLGVAAGEMRTLSYGEEQLARDCALQADDSCHRMNRRVEFSLQ